MAAVLAGIALLIVIEWGCEKAQPPSSPSGSTTSAKSGAGAVAEAGATPNPGAAWFTESAAARGIVFRHDSGHRKRFLFPECVCGGAALFDMDNDGDLDAYLVQAGSLEEPAAARRGNQLFRNRGDGTFEDVTSGSGADARGYGMGVAAGDYDNDGFVDLYVTNHGPNVLLRNELGSGRFTDVSTKAGVGHDGFGSSAAFVDYDADGDLDLYVVNYVYWTPGSEQACYSQNSEPDYCSPKVYAAPARDVLYRNDGNGSFADVSAAAGIHAAFGNGLGVVCGDFNGDGMTDIFVANDGSPNQLWMNLGSGRFEDRATRAGCAIDTDGTAKAGMGVAAVDLDDDQDLDLLVVNLDRETDSLYVNQSAGSPGRREAGPAFVESARRTGLAPLTRSFTRFGVALLDFDNDGLLDLFEANGRVMRQSRLYSDDPYAEPNSLLRGIAARPGTAAGALPAFAEVLPPGGTSPTLFATGRAAAFGDIDNDGGIDILIANRDGPAFLLYNDIAARQKANGSGNWIMFRAVDERGRDAYGATVAMKLGDRTIQRDVRSAYSYCAANDPRVHVGLGAATKVGSVTVRWVDGVVEAFGDQSAGRIVSLKRGTGKVQPAAGP